MKVNTLKSKAFVRNSVYRAKQYGVEFSTDFDGEDIIRRDGQNCYLCGTNLTINQIQFEHIIPLSRGGCHTADNVKIACRVCNSEKSRYTEIEYLLLRTIKDNLVRIKEYGADFLLERDGWILTRQKGSHKTFTHPTKTGVVVVPEHGGDIPIGTLNSILKQAGLKKGK